MRFLVALVLSGSLIVGCGDNGSVGPRSSCATDGMGGAGGVDPSSPVLTNIAWDPIGFCLQDTRHSYNVFVFALDPDTPPSDLVFDVDIPDCSPVTHRGNVFVVSCPNRAPHTGVACAEDPEGNTSSRAVFTFPTCLPGDCMQFPDACDLLAPDPS